MATPRSSSLIERLIKEARERARRRRLWIGAAALAVAVAAVLPYTQLSQGSAGVAACRSGDFRLTIGPNGETGSILGMVEAASRHGATCHLSIPVRFSVTTPTGVLVSAIHGNPSVRRFAGTLWPSRLLEHGWAWSNWCGATNLLFTVEGGGQTATLALGPGGAGVARCDQPRAPSRLTYVG